MAEISKKETVQPQTLWRTEKYKMAYFLREGSTEPYHHSSVYGGGLRKWVVAAIITAIVVAILSVLVGICLLTRAQDMRACEIEGEVKNYETHYTFLNGCIKGYDDSDRLELDGDVNLNVNTEE